MKKLKILDTTLREGEKTPGVSFNVQQKLEIAHALDKIGVDAIEVGYPGTPPDKGEFIKEVQNEDLSAELVVHSYASEGDIEAALATGVERVAVFQSSSNLHFDETLGKRVTQAAEMIYSSIKQVTDCGRKARFTAEGATKADLDVLYELSQAALDAGADRISLPDTAESVMPKEMNAFFRRLKTRFGNVGLDAHCHNGRGIALANSLAAWEGGADCIHVTVNGLGERSGIVPLCYLAFALKIFYGVATVNVEGLQGLSDAVAGYSGIQVLHYKPAVGANAFSPKVHINNAGVPCSVTDELFPTDIVDQKRKIAVDKYRGKNRVKTRRVDQGITERNEEIREIVAEIKKSIHALSLGDDDLLRLANRMDWERRIVSQIYDEGGQKDFGATIQ